MFCNIVCREFDHIYCLLFVNVNINGVSLLLMDQVRNLEMIVDTLFKFDTQMSFSIKIAVSKLKILDSLPHIFNKKCYSPVNRLFCNYLFAVIQSVPILPCFTTMN